MTHDLKITTIEELLAGGMSIREACEKLQVHRSTIWRLTRRFQKKGPEALVHGLKGRRSNRAKPEAFRKQICDLYLSEYKPKGKSVFSFYAAVGRDLPDYVSYSTVLSWLRDAESVHSGKA